MGTRRMFSKLVVDSDLFLDMPLSTQSLYFHLVMRADDDGFIGNPKRILKMIGCNQDELKLLIVKNFIIPFESGVIVIKHWRLHNYIQSDRYHGTIYKAEKDKLEIDDNKYYLLKNESMDTLCIHSESNLDTEVKLSKDKLSKDKKEINKEKRKKFQKPSLQELVDFCSLEKLENVDCEKFINYYDSNGWMVGKNHMKDWKATARNWNRKQFPQVTYGRQKVKLEGKHLNDYQTLSVNMEDLPF